VVKGHKLIVVSLQQAICNGCYSD